MLSRICLGLLTAMSLASCATPAQRQYQAIAANTQSTVSQGVSCVSAVYSSPEAAPIGPRTPFGPSQASLSQLADPSYASPQEIAAINAIHPRSKACAQQAIEGLGRTTPGMAAILARAIAEGENDVVQLVQRRMTWGQYNTRRRDRVLATQAAALSEERQVVGELQLQNAIQQQQQQQAIGNIMAGAALIEASRPRPVSPTLNCMSTPLGTGGVRTLNCH